MADEHSDDKQAEISSDEEKQSELSTGQLEEVSGGGPATEAIQEDTVLRDDSKIILEDASEAYISCGTWSGLEEDGIRTDEVKR